MDYNRILIVFRKSVMEKVGYEKEGVREGLILAMRTLTDIEEAAVRGKYVLPGDKEEA